MNLYEAKSKIKYAINDVIKQKSSLYTWVTDKLGVPCKVQYILIIINKGEYEIKVLYDDLKRDKINNIYNKYLFKNIKDIFKKYNYDIKYISSMSAGYKNVLRLFKDYNYIGYNFETKQYDINILKENLTLKSILNKYTL